MKKLLGTILAAEIAICALSASAYAKPMHFFESSVSGGDFANIEDISNINIGTTPTQFMSVSGSISGSCNIENSGFVRCSAPSGILSPDDSLDSFLFSIGDKSKLSKVTVTTRGNGPDGFTVGVGMNEYVEGYSYPVGTTYLIQDFSATQEYKFSSGTSFTPYRYSGFNTFGIAVEGFTADAGGFYNVNWNVDLEFAATSPSTVPIPASAPLLIAAIGGLTALRKKRRKAAAKS